MPDTSRRPARSGRMRPHDGKRASGLRPLPQLSAGRHFNHRPLADYPKRFSAFIAPAIGQRTAIRPDRIADRTAIGSDGQPFEFEPEYNGDQAIDDRMLPSCPRHRAAAATPGPPYPRLAQAPPMRAYFLRRLEFSRTPKPKHTLGL